MLIQSSNFDVQQGLSIYMSPIKPSGDCSGARSKMTPLYRIYFDTNDGTMQDGYPLMCKGAQDDIQPIASKLSEGMHVIIYMTDELEMEAILEFDQAHNCWIGRPIEGTLKYLDGSEPNPN
jgi:hypothetical protein